MSILNREPVTREQALAAWNDPEMHELFALAFDEFEDYWDEVQELNNMSDISYLAYVRKAQNLSNVRWLLENYAEQKSDVLPTGSPEEVLH